MKEKELKQKLEVEDFKKDSGISKETMQNVIDSFRSYLKLLDLEQLTEVDFKGNKWCVDSLNKLEKRIIRNCTSAIKGDCALIDEKGQMSSLNSTEKIIMKLITEVQMLILVRKKYDELTSK